MGRHAATTPAAPSTGAVATATNLSKIYGSGETRVVALDDVDVAFGRGEFTAIMGPSGSGKATLLHCMAGLDSPTSGQIVVDGLDISHMSQRELTRVRRTRIGFVFQAYNLIPTLTVAENAAIPLLILGSRRSEALARAGEMLAAVGLGDKLDSYPAALSGGQQQRVAIARMDDGRILLVEPQVATS